ncbi:hypothetical protein RJT34_29424 [Clitoria ternatea]|uniref:Uncharacterized protein n=1 Tax=Clitoria ternatea TaxID=43366 RepID=A0AAN9IAX1_CLITE
MMERLQLVLVLHEKGKIEDSKRVRSTRPFNSWLQYPFLNQHNPFITLYLFISTPKPTFVLCLFSEVTLEVVSF